MVTGTETLEARPEPISPPPRGTMMQGLPVFNPRSDALKRRDEPGKGDDVPCVKCGGALDTGLECTECGHDNHEAVTGKPFTRSGAVIDMNAAHKTAPTDAIRAGAKERNE